MATWQLQEAKGKFSEVVKRALSEGPQGITVRREPEAVLISHAEYARLTHPKPGFVEFMRRSPLAGLELDIGRASRLDSRDRAEMAQELSRKSANGHPRGDHRRHPVNLLATVSAVVK